MGFFKSSLANVLKQKVKCPTGWVSFWGQILHCMEQKPSQMPKVGWGGGGGEQNGVVLDLTGT